LWLYLGVIGLSFVAGLLFAQWGWSRGIEEFTQALFQHPGLVWAAYRQRATVPTLHFDLAFQDAQRLASRRAQALTSGVNLVGEDDYVPAQVSWGDARTDVSIRLPQASASLLSGTRWPLELAATQSEPVLGMASALLLPAREDALVTAGYLTMLRDAGFPVVDRHFVRVTFNGVDWGVYTMESRVAPEGMSSAAVMVSFDTREFLATPVLDRASGFAYAQVEVSSPALAEGEELVLSAEVVQLLRAIAQGEAAPTRYFDADALARFLGITTLWYGSPLLDWRTVRWAYDPGSQTFTPIGVGTVPDPTYAWPQVFTDDPSLQRAYAQDLRSLSEPAVLESLDHTALEALRLAVGADLGYPPPPWEMLWEHQQEMRAALSPSRTLFATADEYEGTLRIALEALLPFPVELLGLDFGDWGQMPMDVSWVDPSTRAALVEATSSVVLRARLNETPMPFLLTIPLEVIPVEARDAMGRLSLVTRIWGLDGLIAVPVIWGSEPW